MISFSQTGGTSGITQITITATSNSELYDIVNNYDLENENGYSVLMPIIQKAYVPTEKYITFSPASMSIGSSGGTESLSVQSNDNWVITADDWIQLSRFIETDRSPQTISGDGNTIIGIRFFENLGEARTGTISGYCVSDSSITASTVVSQAGSYVKPYIIVSPHSADAQYNASSYTFSVSSNTSWITSSDARWITINTLSGTGNSNVSFSVSSNNNNFQRIGTITVFNVDEGISDEFTLVQEAESEAPYIKVDPNSFNVSWSGTSGNAISVSANCDYDITTDVVWITTNAASGSGDGSVSFTTLPNSGSSDAGNIVLANSAVSQVVSVQRQAVGKYLSASTNYISSSSTGGTFEVSVYSNVNWSVSVDTGEGELSTPWMSVSPSSGSNDGSIRISVGSGYTAVSGSVVLNSAEYGLSCVVDVEREKYVNNSVIFYTSTGNTVINVPTTGWGGGVNLVSNIYENGQGVIVFDNDVINIPSYSFYDSDLSSIILPESVENLFKYAFYHCPNLKSITMPPCEFLSAWVFGWNSINEVNFLGTLEQWITTDNLISSSWGGNNDVIDPNGFDLYLDGELLIHADFSSYSGSIRTDAISQCKNLTGVTIGENVTYISDAAFRCPNLVYVSYNAINAQGPTPSSYPIYYGSEFGSITTFEIGENVEKITNMVIGSGGSLTTIYAHPIVVPDISTTYFRFATNGTLHYLSGTDYSTLISRLPSGWTAVDDITPTGYYLIVSPTGFTVDATGSTGNQVTILSNVSYSISTNVDWITLSDISGTGNKTISFSTNSTISTIETSGTITVSNGSITETVSVTREAYSPIVPKVIYYTSTGNTVVTPYVTTGWGGSIVSNTYENNQGVMTFGTVTNVPSDAYYSKKALKTIVLAGDITAIGKEAFLYCEKLESVTIGSNVASLGNNVFYGCSVLTEINCYSTTAPTLGVGVFGVASSGTLHYPSGSDYSTWVSQLPSGWTAVADL